MTSVSEFPSIHELIDGIDPGLRAGVEALIEKMAAGQPPNRSSVDIVGSAAAMVSLAGARAEGDTIIGVYTPTEHQHDWSSRHTVVDICTPDAPFLVDSVTAAVARHGLAVHLLLHPVISVRRDEAGSLLELGAHGGELESWIHLEVDLLPTEEARLELDAVLRKVLTDVHAAVRDWEQMRRACLDIVTDLRTAPPATVDPASVAPTVEFLSWLADDNFTFLGYREHLLDTDADGSTALRAIPHTGLGILRGVGESLARLTPEAQRTAREARLLTVSKANARATVHRDVYLDYIGVRIFDEQGAVIGERRFLGMFTSAAYAASVMTLPIVASKVRAVLSASGHALNSHSGKDLLQVLEQYPRDELFQDDVPHLLAVASEISRLRERRGSRIFLRRDEFGRFVSALVFLPRDRFNTTVRMRIEALLRDAFGAEQIDHATQVGESPLAQLHFVVRMPKGVLVPEVDESRLQTELEAAIRSWEEGLVEALHQDFGADRAAQLLASYGRGFPEAYKEEVVPAEAIGDLLLLEELDQDREFAVRLSGSSDGDLSRRVLTVASHRLYPLTQVLPILTDLGVDVVDERPYTAVLPNGETRHLSDFGLALPHEGLWGDEDRAHSFERAFEAVWRGDAESDRLNSLVLLAGLDWRRIVILRAISMYLRQAGSSLSVEYIEQALTANPEIAAALVGLFELRFDPELGDERDAKLAELHRSLQEQLDRVASLDHDRIIRSFVGVIDATWRTNFYQRAADGSPKPWVSMKLDCKRVPGLPKPHPMAEIWVYSPEVEGVHLRFGKVARGGLRWSDRREDFRTEVLGLVKAQMVKNAVIVPTGSKGGFFAKQLPSPSDRAAWLEGGRAAYRTFIRGLLDLTDNRDAGDIVPPAGVLRHDGDDPYLVVAADKGTASFSDIANAISEEYGFWLGDAFASGGSAGYDHKGMGITARGAWESVKRHFRELGQDTQTEAFTAVGIGDMSGDVFGNGMLRSDQLRLVAAFDHRHVFVDPSPDATTGFLERRRLFDLAGSSWDDYDRALISKGGGVFSLAAKSIPVSPEMAAALGLDDSVESLTPADLKRAVLLAPADLLWNGGIGTYIKASTETDAEIGDRGNDAVRVNGNELRVRVVGEGGNLGASQRGRIEAALAGVRINTDAIDNSAGVGTSDREVNIKILLGAIERDGRLSREDRDDLLRAMTDEVAVQVLRDNYEQNVLLGNSRANAAEMLPSHERLIEWLEERDELDRELEFLPSREQVAELIAGGKGLTRPEFAVLVAYAKLALKADLAGTGLASDPWFERTLAEYFPEQIRAAYADDLDAHPLRAEIIVNSVVNSMVNRGGITFAYRAADETGASTEQIARAYVVAREVCDLRGFIEEVEATDNLVSSEVQTDLYLSFRRLLDRVTRWFVVRRPNGIDIGSEIATFSEPIAQYAGRLGELLRGDERVRYEHRLAELVAAGVPEGLASRGAGLLESMPLLDIVELSRLRDWPLAEVAEVYFELSALVRFDDALTRVTALPQDDRWGSMARAAMREDLYSVMSELTASVVEGTESGDDPESRVLSWIDAGGDPVRRVLAEAVAAIGADPETGLATISVALRRLRSLVR